MDEVMDWLAILNVSTLEIHWKGFVPHVAEQCDVNINSFCFFFLFIEIPVSSNRVLMVENLNPAFFFCRVPVGVLMPQCQDAEAHFICRGSKFSR
ncbi:hypothetical protein TNCV_3412791 [Trichonephila clavipes]|uniref:Uncharacterized protein n=1 Tax=Trichonephila clavipes TaxID=2585209 RepID=A0A8X6UV48_TRICX|nr:hypothetical protein TNCV_3412791 [Trichonephila clavipes]